MAKAPSILQVRLHARSQPQLQQQSISGKTCLVPRSTWIFDVYVTGKKVLQDVLLEDPLSRDQRPLCRWYLEKYVQESPYSVDLAKDAEMLLSMYPEQLLHQLQLQDVLAPYLTQETTENKGDCLLMLEICHELSATDGPESTVHQIFWETLETSTLSRNSGWTVIVQRVIHPLLNLGFPPPCRVKSRKQADMTSTTVNILLVVGRRISRDPALYNDITPFLATKALAQIQQQLESSDATLKLHIEIARPGTLTSFEAHLQRSEEIHGPNYFHIVHFDLHGTVATKKGLKRGFLYFCKPNSDDTKAVAADDVGTILRRYSIPFVILNACESGTANRGDDANIAHIFQRYGVQTTLAMSFSISGSAAELFLSKFYQSLLLDGYSFASSAAVARRTLHQNCSRPARFGLQRDLSDSFVPVIYGSGQDWAFTFAGESRLSFSSKPGFSSMTSSGSTALPPASGLLGRDFDVLRLEKLLLQGNMVCVHGLAGIGKSAFLRYASYIWRRTAFVDAVITVDFAERLILSEKDLLETILRQLLEVTGQHYRARLWTVTSLSLESHNEEAIKLVIEDLLLSLKVAVILDGLDIAFTPFDSSLVPGTLDEVQTFEIWQAIKSTFFPIQTPPTTREFYLIGTTRRQDTEWLTSLSSNQLRAQSYELRGLELPDAIELSQKIISTCGNDLEEWKYEDYRWLEAIIDLLQGIPLALLEILPAQQALDIPWRLFHARLHGGLVTSPADLKWLGHKNYQFLGEIHHLASVLSKHDFLFLSLFSNYWHKAPPLAVLQQFFIDATNDSPKQMSEDMHNPEILAAPFSSLLGFALDRGYIRVDSHGIRPWVHPLFTIYGRAFALKYRDFEEGQNTKQHIVDSIQLLSCLPPVLSSNAQEDFNVAENPPAGNGNLLTCLNFCIMGQTVIPVEKWPLQLFMASLVQIFYFPYAGTPPWISEKYYQLLKSFAGQSRASIGDELIGTFFSIVLFVCVSNPDHIQWSVQQYRELYELGSKMIRALERNYGQEFDSKAALSKGTLLCTQIILLRPLEREMEAETILKTLKSLNDELFDQLMQEPELSLDSGFGILYKTFGGIADILLKHQTDFLPRTSNEVSEESKSISGGKKPLRDFLGQQVEKFSREELEDASRLSPRNLQVTKIAKKGTHFPALDLLENSIENCDWVSAFEQHRSMFFIAMYSFLHDEADEHIKALREMSRSLSSDVTPTEVLLTHLEEMVRQQRSQYMLICSLFPSEASGRQDALEIAEQLRLSLAEIAPEQVYLADRYCTEIKETTASGGYPTQISRELAVKLMRKHGKKRGDLRWTTNLNITLESFARFISEVNDFWNARKFDSCLGKLDLIDELVEKEEFLHDLISERPQALKRIREACDNASAVLKVSSIWYCAISEKDFDGAWSYVEELSRLLKNASPNMPLANEIAIMHKTTESEHIGYLMQGLKDAHSAKELKKGRKICKEVEKQWTNGKFPSIDRDQMRSFAVNLEWMIEQAVDMELWEDGLEICDEYLVTSAWKLIENPRALDRFVNIREELKSSLLQRYLGTAEADGDFEKCLALVDDLEKLWKAQMQTREIHRTSFIILSQKLLQFLRCCYRDCCVPCARWARLREETSCAFHIQNLNQRGRYNRTQPDTQSHDRNSLVAPFGCSHHCRGGYCLLD